MEAGTYTFETGSDRVLGICRELDGKRLVSYYNFSGVSVKIDKGILGDGKGYKDLVTEKKLSGEAGEIEGYGYLWLYRE